MDYLDVYTTEDVKTMITAWHSGNAQGMEANDDLLIVVAKILAESAGYSISMKWVSLGGNPFAREVSVALTAASNYAINMVNNTARMLYTLRKNCCSKIQRRGFTSFATQNLG